MHNFDLHLIPLFRGSDLWQPSKLKQNFLLRRCGGSYPESIASSEIRWNSKRSSLLWRQQSSKWSTSRTVWQHQTLIDKHFSDHIASTSRKNCSSQTLSDAHTLASHSQNMNQQCRSQFARPLSLSFWRLWTLDHQEDQSAHVIAHSAKTEF